MIKKSGAKTFNVDRFELSPSNQKSSIPETNAAMGLGWKINVQGASRFRKGISKFPPNTCSEI